METKNAEGGEKETTMTTSKNSRFQRGSGVYKCECCEKMTRATGEGEEDIDLCRKCADSAELENLHSDEDHENSPAADCFICQNPGVSCLHQLKPDPPKPKKEAAAKAAAAAQEKEEDEVNEFTAASEQEAEAINDLRGPSGQGATLDLDRLARMPKASQEPPADDDPDDDPPAPSSPMKEVGFTKVSKADQSHGRGLDNYRTAARYAVWVGCRMAARVVTESDRQYFMDPVSWKVISPDDRGATLKAQDGRLLQGLSFRQAKDAALALGKAEAVAESKAAWTAHLAEHKRVWDGVADMVEELESAPVDPPKVCRRCDTTIGGAISGGLCQRCRDSQAKVDRARLFLDEFDGLAQGLAETCTLGHYGCSTTFPGPCSKAARTLLETAELLRHPRRSFMDDLGQKWTEASLDQAHEIAEEIVEEGTLLKDRQGMETSEFFFRVAFTGQIMVTSKARGISFILPDSPRAREVVKVHHRIAYGTEATWK